MTLDLEALDVPALCREVRGLRAEVARQTERARQFEIGGRASEDWIANRQAALEQAQAECAAIRARLDEYIQLAETHRECEEAWRAGLAKDVEVTALRAELESAKFNWNESLNQRDDAEAALADAIARAEAAERVVDAARDLKHANEDPLRSDKRPDIAWRDVLAAIRAYDAAKAVAREHEGGQ